MKSQQGTGENSKMEQISFRKIDEKEKHINTAKDKLLQAHKGNNEQSNTEASLQNSKEATRLSASINYNRYPKKQHFMVSPRKPTQNKMLEVI